MGERQLVALVRAQLGDPGLLILDEATSAVDPATEQRITEALRRLSAGRTTVTIAHRLSTAEAADHVFVFDAGQTGRAGHARRARGAWAGCTPASTGAGSATRRSTPECAARPSGNLPP